jgi:uncharacterized membrane protein
MEARNVTLERGWGWILEGWQLFVKNPAVWVITGVIFFVIFMILSFVPFVGLIAIALLGPVLGGGLMYAADQLDKDQSIEIQTMFQGFRDNTKLNPLLMLGVIAVVGGVVFMLLGMLIVGGSMSVLFMDGGETAHAGFGIGLVFGMFVVAVLELLLIMLFFFSIPLVMLNGVAPVDAVKLSFRACLQNILPFLVFSVAVIVLSFIAAIPFGLGFLILWPLLACSQYRAYRDVFGVESTSVVPEESEQAPAPQD